MVNLAEQKCHFAKRHSKVIPIKRCHEAKKTLYKIQFCANEKIFTLDPQF